MQTSVITSSLVYQFARSPKSSSLTYASEEANLDWWQVIGLGKCCALRDRTDEKQSRSPDAQKHVFVFVLLPIRRT